MLAEAATHAGAADAEMLVDALLKEAFGGRGWWSAYTPRTLRAYLHVRAGQPARARRLLETVFDLNRKEIEDGDRESALAAFERAVDLGYFGPKADVCDALLASLKDDPRFLASLDRVRRRITEMRTRVDLGVIDDWIARGRRQMPIAEERTQRPCDLL